MNDIDIESSKIMIVDDTPQNLGVLEKMLVGKGYHIFAVTSGEAALKIAEKNPPDIFLLDINMPGMNGYQLGEKIKQSESLKEIPIIFLSALDEPEDKIKGFKSGGVDYITKPFQLDEVEARVKAHLTIHHLQIALQKHNANLENLVAERTKDLDNAYKRLKNLENLKSEFLSMISHELRTPLNGILVVSELAFEQCKNACDMDELQKLFTGSRERLERLLDDALLINELDVSSKKMAIDSFEADALFEGQSVRASIEAEAGKPIPEISGNLVLLKKAMDNILKTALCFSLKKDKVEVKLSSGEGFFNVSFFLQNLKISDEHAAGFFSLASISRQCSLAQDLSLAPVVAAKIFELFGGGIKMIKHDDSTGEFLLSFPIRA